MEVLVRDIIKKAEEKLKEAGVVDFAVDSWLLAEFVFKINRTGFYMDPMMTVSKERADKGLLRGSHRRKAAHRSKDRRHPAQQAGRVLPQPYGQGAV